MSKFKNVMEFDIHSPTLTVGLDEVDDNGVISSSSSEDILEFEWSVTWVILLLEVILEPEESIVEVISSSSDNILELERTSLMEAFASSLESQ